MRKAKRLQGMVLHIEKTGEKNADNYGNIWEKCIFMVELVSFSKRTSKRALPTRLKGKRVKLIRWCCFDWHYKLGARKTLDADETEAVLKGKPTDTIFW